MKFSNFIEQFDNNAGIIQLMDDLGKALTENKEMLMLGGGNPSYIPEVATEFKQALTSIIDSDDDFQHLLGNYDQPQGNQAFISTLTQFLNSQYNWNLKPENIALTSGSQMAFFYLFNMFSGQFKDGTKKQILLPMTPEYIGYADVGLSEDMFYSYKPVIEELDNKFFKYHVDFNNLVVKESTGAICVSRPTNPTGNVLTDDEIQRLNHLSKEHDIPLIIDNAYGLPFPNILFAEAEFFWEQNIICCMSLSKIGLPGVRMGIVIAHETVIEKIRNLNAIMQLSGANLGPMLGKKLLQEEKIKHLSNKVIKPFYQNKLQHALNIIDKQFDNINVKIHKPEGAIFLWLWFPELSISSSELYQRLKRQGVLIIDGSQFFPGLEKDWKHKHECIRVTYSMDAEIVEKGLELIAEEVRQLN